MPGLSTYHDGVASPYVALVDALGTFLAQQMDGFSVPIGDREHMGSLVLFIERDAVCFMAKLEESFHAVDVPKRGCEMERGVGAAEERRVGVLQEGGVRFEDALHEGDVTGVDGSTQA